MVRLLPELGVDEIDALTQHLSPQAVGRLRSTCRAFAAAVAENPAWAWLRAEVLEGGWDGACRAASAQGQLDALPMASAEGCSFTRITCMSAAAGGQINVLKWLRARSSPCERDETACEAAAKKGRLEVLQFLRSQSPPCPWGEGVCMVAACGGHLETLQWLRAESPPCPWKEPTVFDDAVSKSQLGVVQWLLAKEPPCPRGSRACEMAALHGHLELLQWMRARTPPYPWDAEQMVEYAVLGGYFVAGGNIEVLQFLRAQLEPCPWGKATCEGAASEGRLEALRWLRRQSPPCPWNVRACLRAAQRVVDGGVYPMFRYTRYPELVLWLREEVEALGEEEEEGEEEEQSVGGDSGDEAWEEEEGEDEGVADTGV